MSPHGRHGKYNFQLFFHVELAETSSG